MKRKTNLMYSEGPDSKFLFFSNYDVFKEKLLRRGEPIIQLEKLNELKTYIDILTKRDIKVISYRGLGCINETSNRIGIIEFLAE